MGYATRTDAVEKREIPCPCRKLKKFFGRSVCGEVALLVILSLLHILFVRVLSVLRNNREHCYVAWARFHPKARYQLLVVRLCTATHPPYISTQSQ